MSKILGPDWKALADAQKIALNDTQKQRLETLARTMLGLRGLVDWGEEPAQSFKVERVAPPAEEDSK